MTENVMLLLAVAISILVIAILRWKTSVAGLSHSVLVALACFASAIAVILIKEHSFNYVHVLVDALLAFGPVDLFSKAVVAVFKRQPL